MHPTDELIEILKKLRFTGLLESLDIRRKEAVEDNLSHVEFLYRLLSDELERREAKKLQNKLRRAMFEEHKTLEDFEFQFNPKIPKAKILDLASCSFIERHENVALIGPCGVGKSHISQAIGHRACRAGFDVLYTPAQKMFAYIRSGKADNTYERKLLRFITPHLLIIDDLGLLPLQKDEPSALFEIIRARYEKSSTIITSNRDIQEWYSLFENDLLASSTLDRFFHHAHVVIMDGRSYRSANRSIKNTETQGVTNS
jgi:DNA replication protein DnaC